MRFVKAFLSAAVLAALVWALQTPHGMIPPLGKLASPFAGFWRNNASGDKVPERIDLPGLQEPVEVVWDDLRIPHVFARNNRDLFFAQGFIMARDRLWQMEFIARFAGGRLAEIVGPRALDQDRFQRRIGMNYAAENFLKGMEGNAEAETALQAYVDGVNAHVRSLKPADYPLEYKILDYAPEVWSAKNGALLLKYMAWDLTGGNRDLALTRMRDELGAGVVDELFPFAAPFQDPVIPPGTTWDFKAKPGQGSAGTPGGGAEAGPKGTAAAAASDPWKDMIGSNNWALAGTRTK
ncbi:MAG: penicillin acylase family protein, partial [Candidatus Aminicenantes bacterium]|nr:penicillin acylase family protein [Candidatus Aminicenantes bacterium]